MSETTQLVDHFTWLPKLAAFAKQSPITLLLCAVVALTVHAYDDNRMQQQLDAMSRRQSELHAKELEIARKEGIDKLRDETSARNLASLNELREQIDQLQSGQMEAYVREHCRLEPYGN